MNQHVFPDIPWYIEVDLLQIHSRWFYRDRRSSLSCNAPYFFFVPYIPLCEKAGVNPRHVLILSLSSSSPDWGVKFLVLVSEHWGIRISFCSTIRHLRVFEVSEACFAFLICYLWLWHVRSWRWLVERWASQMPHVPGYLFTRFRGFIWEQGWYLPSSELYRLYTTIQMIITPDYPCPRHPRHQLDHAYCNHTRNNKVTGQLIHVDSRLKMLRMFGKGRNFQNASKNCRKAPQHGRNSHLSKCSQKSGAPVENIDLQLGSTVRNDRC